MLETFEIEPTEKQTASVIWLHGLGASNRDFETIVPELGAASVRFVFPAAPVRPVTINGGMSMPAWYDILTLQDPPLRESEADVRQISPDLAKLIEREHERGVPYNKIVIAGFSQGGAMALHVGTRFPEKLAGIMVLSAYLLLPDKLEPELSPHNIKTPVLCCHGSYDPTVPIALGKATFERIRAAGLPATFHEYPMEHSLCMEEVHEIKTWLSSLI